MRRVNEALKEVLSGAIARGVKDPRMGFVTITSVDATTDVRQAKVFVSVLGSAAEKEATLVALRSAHGFLQGVVNDELHLRRTPSLEFVYDTSIDRGMRIGALIKDQERKLGIDASLPAEEPGPEAGDDGKAVMHAEVAARLRGERRIIIMAHENPDGDAIGCVVALMLMAERLGIPYYAYLPGETPIPEEYRFLPGIDRILRGPFPPVDADTSAYIMDCASASRLDLEGLRCAGACLNLDHHQDNTAFGTHNLLDRAAASTTQILYEIFTAGGFPIDAEVGTALYIGLVTDTGRFQYTNTTPAAHRMAAGLQEAGVDVTAVYRAVYETLPLVKVQLLQRALARLQMRLAGRLALSWLEASDFAELGADESHTEGIIDSLRTISGVRIAALLRERLRDGATEYKASLRATDGVTDVASIAHLQEGGGHTQAAGYTTHQELDVALDWIEDQVRRRL
ncbi:MAG: 30S ribosome-binding factor RbfA [Thermoleophilia bacterium]|nr:30S ribosome-binding factor RbfA [Thermoleophilia bacterium]